MINPSQNRLHACSLKRALKKDTIFDIGQAQTMLDGHRLTPMQTHFEAGFFNTFFTLELPGSPVDPLDGPAMSSSSLSTSSRQAGSSSLRLGNLP
jgi:hypothetical protein